MLTFYSKIICILIVICALSVSVHSKVANKNDTLRAYQNMYGKYLNSTSQPSSASSKEITTPNSDKFKLQNNKSASVLHDEYEDGQDEFTPEAEKKADPLEELEELLVRVQRDIQIKKSDVENVVETLDTGKKQIAQVLREAYNNFSTAIKSKDTFNRSKYYTKMGEFPNDFMTDHTREKGGFVLHILIFIYLSLVLAFICDKYFLKSLEYICEVLAIPSDVGGATFMAIGTSAPELFTSIIGVFISDNDIGTGTIVGSAVFNLLVVPGACGYAAYKHLTVRPKISPFPILRDTLFYILTIITLILCIKDNQVDWIESTTLLGLYGLYIVVMYFNTQISHVISLKSDWQPIASTSLTEDKNSPLMRKKAYIPGQRSLGSLSSISNSDSGVDYKIMKAGESSPLLTGNSSRSRSNNGSITPLPVYESNGHTHHEHMRHSVTGSDTDVDYSRIRLEPTTEGKFKQVSSSRSDSGAESPSGSLQNNAESLKMKINLEALDNQTDCEGDWSDNPFLEVILFPFRIIFWVTLPRPTQYTFVLTFLSSVVWIAILSYVIVWMVTILGITFSIPDTVAGITILAAGTSIPELISSYLLVKKSGLVDMALCNSIGSNIFDILFCLGLPWLIRTLVTMLSKGFGFATLAAASIPIRSTALPFTSLTLLMTVACMLAIFKFTNWRLGFQTFIYCMIVYLTFVVTTTILELNA